MFEKLRFLFILLTVYTLSSCNSIIDDAPCADDGVLKKVMFTLTVDDAGRQTRAAWEEGYITAEAVPYDNRIAYDGLRVFFFSTAGSYIGEVANLMHWPVSESEYRLAGDVTALQLKSGTQYKVMVFANCHANVGDLDGTYYDLSNVVYPYGYIPMWGVMQFEADGSEQQDAGEIALLRSMAKVEVVLSNEMLANGYSLDAAFLNNHNSKGYCVPSGWSSVAYTTALDQEQCMNAFHSYVDTPLALYEYEPGRRYWIYVPEFNVLHTADNRPNISVTLGDGTQEPLEFPNSIRFGSYDANGDLVDKSEANIVRNHIYRFNITGITSGIEIDYEVLDWDYDEDENNWERGEFAYPTYHNPVVPDYITPSEEITIDPVMKYNSDDNQKEGDAFAVWFKMDKPEMQTWTPVVNKANTEYEIRVYKSNAPDVQLTDPADWVADSENWYRIVVIPLNPANSGTEVDFGITYTQSWMPDGSSLYLFINGTSEKIAWPNSGSDPKIIRIRQL